MNLRDQQVTACIPHFRCRRYIRRAVESLLNQTHRNLTVVVVNDGDSEPPWKELSSIKDPRLVRFHLPMNRGPYFATDVVLNATLSPFFLIQDADDWSSPQRVERLLHVLQRDRSDLAVSAEPQFVETNRGERVIETRWRTASNLKNAGNFVVHHRITSAYKYRAPHHGLFRSTSLHSVGGYFGGLRISYDTLLPNLILMTGRISHTPDALYYRLIRAESLTHGPSTGIGSAKAKWELATQHRLYQECFACYRLYIEGTLTSSQLSKSIRNICSQGVTTSDRKSLTQEAKRLATLLRGH